MINIISLYYLYVNLFFKIIQKTFTIKVFEKNKNITLIIKAIKDKKGIKITLINLDKIINSPCCFFIICTANSKTHINAIANNIKKVLSDISHQDEGAMSNWRLLDYMNIVVHILTTESRSFYRLEELWNDGLIKHLDDINDNLF